MRLVRMRSVGTLGAMHTVSPASAFGVSASAIPTPGAVAALWLTAARVVVVSACWSNAGSVLPRIGILDAALAAD